MYTLLCTGAIWHAGIHIICCTILDVQYTNHRNRHTFVFYVKEPIHPFTTPLLFVANKVWTVANPQHVAAFVTPKRRLGDLFPVLVINFTDDSVHFILLHFYWVLRYWTYSLVGRRLSYKITLLLLIFHWN